ncbi:hypothetical protein ACFLXW_00300 [Candidatus Dependentiae bacterium]
MNKHVLSLLLVCSTSVFAMQRGGMLAARVARGARVAVLQVPRAAVQASAQRADVVLVARKSYAGAEAQAPVRAPMAMAAAALCIAAGVNSSSEDSVDKLIQLPSANILEDRLRDLHVEDFAEKTHIVDKLAGRELFPEGVVFAIELALADFVITSISGHKEGSGIEMAHRMLAGILMKQKHSIIEAFLREHPEALVALEKEGDYDPEAARNPFKVKKN